MGKLPKLANPASLYKTYQTTFGGLNHTKAAGDGEIYDMKNMTSDHYPVLTQREKRQHLYTLETAGGAMYAYGGCIFYVDNEELLRVVYPWYKDIYGNHRGFTCYGVEAGEKVFAGYQNRVVIFPDKVAVDVSALGEFVTLVDLQITHPVAAEGDTYLVGTGPNADLYRWDGKDWVYAGKQVEKLEASVKTRVTFLYDGELYDAPAEANTLHGFNARWKDFFSVGDAVTISGCVDVEANNKTVIIREIEDDYLRFYENVFSFPETKLVLTFAKESDEYTGLWYQFDYDNTSYYFQLPQQAYAGTTVKWTIGTTEATLSLKNKEGYLLPDKTIAVVTDPGAVDSFTVSMFAQNYGNVRNGYDEYTESMPVTVARTVPDMDFILADDNRLWGAKGSTIYASKLGDPKNFNVFDGLSTDSYSVALSYAGNVTGVVNFNSYPTFFKEKGIFQVYGNKPSNYQVVSEQIEGVKAGCDQSIAVMKDSVFYISPHGLVRYAGGMTYDISEVLDIEVKDGVAASDGAKYYISATEDGDNYGFYVYDAQRGLWHKEDDLKLTYAAYDEALIGMTESGEIWALSPGDVEGTPEDEFDWMVELADMTYGSPFQKGICKVHIRFDLEPSAEAKAEICYDGGEWELIREFRGTGKRSNVLPIIPHRCDHFRVRMRGTGICDIYSLAVQYYNGSEKY